MPKPDSKKRGEECVFSFAIRAGLVYNKTSYIDSSENRGTGEKMPVELQELWETAVRFCEDNVIGAIIAGTLLLLLVALILLTARGRKRRKQEADKWMAGFEERMAAFERNENPMMPPRESILKSLRENRKARGDDETPADTTRTEAISRSAPEA